MSQSSLASTGVDVTGYCDNVRYEWGMQYACIVTGFYVDGPDYVVGQGHIVNRIPGKNQSDVEAVHIEDQVTRYLPKRMEGLFWNMITYRVENSQLEFLGNFNFYKMLRFLHLDNNIIREVPLGVFSETVNMEWISMNDNRIENLDKDLFRNMPKLRVVSFSGNRLRRLSGDIFMVNLNLESIYFSGNGLATIGTDLMKRLTKVRVANFDSNICINDAFFNDPSLIENLTRQFMTFCSGQCDNMVSADDQVYLLGDQNEMMKQQNQAHKAAKEIYCRRQRMPSSSSSSSSSE